MRHDVVDIATVRRASPVVFLHIPKTGGTSLADALSRLGGWKTILSDDGHISKRLLTDRLPVSEAPVLAHGHPEVGSLAGIAGCRLMTVIREPAQQFVSHYLHLRRDPALLHHADARDLSLSDFARRNPRLILFQALSLQQCFATGSPGGTAAPSVATVGDLIAPIEIVGITDHLEETLLMLARETCGEGGRVRRLNRATRQGSTRQQLGSLLAKYRALRRDPEVGPLIAIEQALYAAARERSSRMIREHRLRLGTVDRLRRWSGAVLRR